MEPYDFDLARWTRELLGQYHSFEDAGQGFGVVGPRDIVYLEELRARARFKCDLGPSAPTDVFVFGLGKSPRRDMTKVGGVPYRPADMPWPVTRTGKDMTFLAQYRFTESKDIVGDLPGDVLLVFCELCELTELSPQDFLRFEWYPLGLEDLWPPGAVPEPDWVFINCYGVRHRTVDYLQDIPVDVLTATVPSRMLSRECLPEQAAAFSRIPAMKIGGLPTHPYSQEDTARAGAESRLLCSLVAIYPSPLASYPLVNVVEPMRGWSLPEMCLDFRDGFYLDLWISEKKEISWLVRFLEA